MKGYVLKDFLVLCEIRGILQVKAPLLKLENELELLWESVSNTSLMDEETHSGEDKNGPTVEENDENGPSAEEEDVNGPNVEEEADLSLSYFYNIATPTVSFTNSNPCGTEDVSSATEDSMQGFIRTDHSSVGAICQVEVDSSFEYSLPEVHMSLSDQMSERDTTNIPVLSPVSFNNNLSQIDDHVTGRNETDNIGKPEEKILRDNEEKSDLHSKSVCEFVGETKSEEDSSFEYSLPNVSVDLSRQLSETNQSPTCTSNQSHVTTIHNSSVGDRETTGSNDSCKDDNDESESEDEKLEKLFSDMKVRSEKKKYIPSRKSLCEFIVSDTEEVIVISDSEEENDPSLEPPAFRTPYSTPAFQTPYGTPFTPNTGIVFWGSPYDDQENVQKVPNKKVVTCDSVRSPFIQRENFFTPFAPTSRTPCTGRSVQALTTPSSHKYFPRFKNDMLKELCQLFNKTVFGGKLTDVEVVWNKKLRTTAGLCQYQGLVARRATIELSTKVCDSYDRLRDTLLHEMCHAACWIIDGNKTAGHGPLWKQWADKAQTHHPGLQPVTRCHDYQIAHKYTYKCVRCDFKMGRHSKSVKLQTARCPCCISELELVPRLKKDGTPAVNRKLNRYTTFIKENYSRVKEASPCRTHTQVLEKINQLYHSVKDSLPS